MSCCCTFATAAVEFNRGKVCHKRVAAATTADAAATAAPPPSCCQRRAVALLPLPQWNLTGERCVTKGLLLPPPLMLLPPLRCHQAAANVVLLRFCHRRSLHTAATMLLVFETVCVLVQYNLKVHPLMEI